MGISVKAAGQVNDEDVGTPGKVALRRLHGSQHCSAIDHKGVTAWGVEQSREGSDIRVGRWKTGEIGAIGLRRAVLSSHAYFQNTLLQLRRFGVGLEPRVSRACAGPLTRRERSGYVFPTGRCVINVMNCSDTPIPTVDLCDESKPRSAHLKRSGDCKHQRRSVYDEGFGVYFSTREGGIVPPYSCSPTGYKSRAGRMKPTTPYPPNLS